MFRVHYIEDLDQSSYFSFNIISVLLLEASKHIILRKIYEVENYIPVSLKRILKKNNKRYKLDI